LKKRRPLIASFLRIAYQPVGKMSTLYNVNYLLKNLVKPDIEKCHEDVEKYIRGCCTTGIQGCTLSGIKITCDG
jgi:hypothetical protein